MAATAIASGGAGSLDRSFGDRGEVMTPFRHGHGHGDSNYGHPNFVPQAYDVLVDSRNRVVAVGTAAQRFALARYKPNGRLDRSFSNDGTVTTQVSVSRNHLSAAYAGAIDSRGRIVAAGFALAKLAQDRIALARYKPNGHLDRSFGDHGEVRTGIYMDAQAIAIDPEGRIVVAGGGPGDCFALARYRPNGELDPSFGGDGTITTTFSDYVDGAYSMAIDSRGRIVAAGLTEPLSGPQDVALARYESDGTLDPSFGSGGKVVTDFGGEDQANSIAIDSQDRIVAAVYSPPQGAGRHFLGNFAVARYSANGSLDGSFGNGGEVATDFDDPSVAHDVAIDSRGRILAAGRTARPSHGRPSPGDRRFAVARYLPDGELDSDFSQDGKTTTKFGGSERVQEANALAFDSRQRIIAAGHVGGQFALARYRGR
jgi:uncharacterized delta-60 repeat protein